MSNHPDSPATVIRTTSDVNFKQAQHIHAVADKILATCRWNPSLAEYENIEKNVPTILHHSCEFGHMSDDIYDKLGIQKDVTKWVMR
jgi:hypothetical protein